MENTPAAISMSWMSSSKPQCLWGCVTMPPCWHYHHVCINFRAGLWSASASQTRRGPVLLNNTRLRGCVYMPLRLHVCAQSHPEHLWYSGRLEPAARLWGSVTHINTLIPKKHVLKKDLCYYNSLQSFIYVIIYVRFFILQRLMSAYLSLALMVVHVETRWGHTSVCAMMASVEAAVRQVRLEKTLLILNTDI